MSLSFLNILSIIILFQLSLLVVFLFTIKKGRQISNRLLAFFFILLMINLADGLLAYYGYYTRFPQLAHIEDGFVFLLGPVIYFYTITLIYRDFKLEYNHLLHAIPFLAITILYQIFYHLQDEDYQKKIQEAIFEQTLPPLFYVTAVLIYIHVCTYIFLAFRKLNVYREKIRDRFSSLEKVNMDWLAFMLWSIVFILLISLLYTFLPAVGLKVYFNFFFAIAFLFIFVFINAVVWKGLRQPEIFAGIDDSPAANEKKYLNVIPETEKAIIQTSLTKAMKEDKLFLNPDLTLDILAAHIGFPSKKVSQVINDSFQQTFYDFINTFRIREAERIMIESADPRLTVLEVMYACGFNSKSSFNTIFKQKTGSTPSAFKNAAIQNKTAAQG